ncbi:MAG: RDD family protein [Microcoleaceae cyanobacterium]
MFSNGLVKLFSCLLFWLFLRVIIVVKNKGQSLGRWTLNLKVIDTQFQKTPDIIGLLKREGLLGIAVIFPMIAMTHLWSGNAGILFWTVPLVIDSGVTLFDTNRSSQTIHDRLSRTVVVGCNRGYSLQLKLQKLIHKIDKINSYVQ